MIDADINPRDERNIRKYSEVISTRKAHFGGLRNAGSASLTDH